MECVTWYLNYVANFSWKNDLLTNNRHKETITWALLKIINLVWNFFCRISTWKFTQPLKFKTLCLIYRVEHTFFWGISQWLISIFCIFLWACRLILWLLVWKTTPKFTSYWEASLFKNSWLMLDYCLVQCGWQLI